MPEPAYFASTLRARLFIGQGYLAETYQQLATYN
jgi:hypothetical protein